MTERNRFNKVFLVAVNYPNSFYKPGDTPEIGLGYIAEILDSNGIEYDVIDMNLGYDLNEVKKRISVFSPDLISLGIKSYQFKHSYRIIEELKKTFPRVKVFVGGVHISVLKEKALRDCPAIDFGVVGEGENVMLELCQGKPLEEIKGLIYRKADSIEVNLPERIKDLDALPFPKYRKFELEKYWYPVRYISTSRGCPFSCTFCCVSQVLGKQWIARSPENVVEEIEYWYDRGLRSFEFIDDNFTLSRERALKILDLIKKRALTGLKINCPNGIRADRVDKELLTKMKEVGFDSVSFGVEVGNNKMLRLIKKGETIERIEQAIALAVSMGFNIHLFFIIGFPGQTEQDVEDAFRLAKKYPVRLANFNNLIPYYGTEVFEECQKKGYLLSPPEEYLNRVSTKAGITVLQTDELPEKEMNRVLRRARKFQQRMRNKYRYQNLKKKSFLIKIMPFPIFNVIANFRDSLTSQ